MFTLHRNVGVCDVDVTRKMKIGAALDGMICCCNFQMDSEKDFAEHLRRCNLGVFVGFRQVEIIRRPEYGEELDFTTTVYDCEGIFGLRNTAVFDEAGAVCYDGWSIGVFVDRSTGVPSKLPDEIRKNFPIDPKRETFEYLSRKIKLAGLEGTPCGSFFVRRCQGDLYGHLNSSRYVEEAEEFLEPDFTYDRLRIEYKAQTRLGETLQCVRYVPRPDCRIIALNGAEEKLHTSVEFSRRA